MHEAETDAVASHTEAAADDMGSIAASAACAGDSHRGARSAGGGGIAHTGCGAPANGSGAEYGGSTDAPASGPGAWDPKAGHEDLASWRTGGDVASTVGRRPDRPSGQQ
jgi:hypothetical protein